MAREMNLPHFTSPETSIDQYFAAGARPQISEPPAVPVSTAAVALRAALARLEAIVDEETAALEEHRRIDLKDINQRKSQSLLELTRLSRLVSTADPEMRPQVEQLRAKLERNQAIVGLNLRAVREIAELVVDLLGEAESDGTYSMPKLRARSADAP